MVDVALGLERVQGVQLLLHLEHVQGGDTHNLGLATLEEGGAVHAGQDLNLGGELTDIGQAAAVDAHLIGEDALAHDVLGQGGECHVDLVVALFEFLALAGQSLLEVFLQLGCGGFALLLAGDGVHLDQAVCGEFLHGCVHVLAVAAEEGQLEGGLAGAGCQVGLSLAQGSDEGLSSLQTLSDDLFGGGGLAVLLDELPGVVGGLSLDHHDGHVFGTVGLGDDATGHGHIEHGVLELGVLGEADPLAVNQGHAHATDGAAEGRTGERGRCRSRVNREGVVDFVRVVGQDGHDDLHLVADALGEGGAQRAVNQAGCQNGLGAGAAFAAEVGCRDLAGCVHALFHVHGQREEVEALAGRLADHGCGEQGGLVIDGDEHRAVSLLGETAGFKAHVALTVNAVVDFDFGKLDFGTFHGSFFLLVSRCVAHESAFDRKPRHRSPAVIAPVGSGGSGQSPAPFVCAEGCYSVIRYRGPRRVRSRLVFCHGWWGVPTGRSGPSDPRPVEVSAPERGSTDVPTPAPYEEGEEQLQHVRTNRRGAVNHRVKRQTLPFYRRRPRRSISER